ncbi:MAG: hypothetical protein Q4G00_12845 [Clostridia bacterium]|nr:hypothetical protein [Clostridia bacterium]
MAARDFLGKSTANSTCRYLVKGFSSGLRTPVLFLFTGKGQTGTEQSALSMDADFNASALAMLLPEDEAHSLLPYKTEEFHISYMPPFLNTAR